MKKLIVLNLFLSVSCFLFSQNNIFREDNKLTYKSEESFKSISFNVGNAYSQESIDKLISLLKNNPDVFNVSFDVNTKRCYVDTRMNLNNKDIIDLTGKNGYKTSEYNEEVNLKIIMPNISFEERAKIESDREEQNRVLNNWPADFPKYIDTDNPELDNANYARTKAEWIKNNPEKYKTISSSTKSYESETEKKDRIERENHVEQ